MTHSNTVGSAIYQKIKDDIIYGKLQPSTKLKLDKLSNSYSVSMSTLRECLNRLSSEGFVSAEEQRGFFVTSNSHNYIEENKTYFNNKLSVARAKNCRLKHIAELKSNGKGVISLEEIKKGDVFYDVLDEENIIIIKSKNNIKNPIVLKGPGAGGSITAKGVLNDILKI